MNTLQSTDKVMKHFALVFSRKALKCLDKICFTDKTRSEFCVE